MGKMQLKRKMHKQTLYKKVYRPKEYKQVSVYRYTQMKSV